MFPIPDEINRDPGRLILGLFVFLLACGESTVDAEETSASQEPAAGEPVFDSSVHRLLWGDDFDAYADLAAVLAVYVEKNPGIHALDGTGGLAGSKAFRIDWPDDSNGGCVDRETLLEKSFSGSQEVFLQFHAKYDPNFRFRWSSDPCNGNAKKIWFFWRAGSGSDRFIFVFESNAFKVGYESVGLLIPNAGSLAPADLTDGAYHRFTFHIRAESSATANDGLIRGWFDGDLKWDYTQIDTDGVNGYDLFKFPTTFNKGSPQAQSEWWDGLLIWANP